MALTGSTNSVNTTTLPGPSPTELRILPVVSSLPHLAAGPGPPPLARSLTFDPWLCMRHGVTTGVSLGALWATHPGATAGVGCHRLPYPDKSMKHMAWRRIRRVRQVFRESLTGWVKSWDPGILKICRVIPDFRLSGFQLPMSSENLRRR